MHGASCIATLINSLKESVVNLGDGELGECAVRIKNLTEEVFNPLTTICNGCFRQASFMAHEVGKLAHHLRKGARKRRRFLQTSQKTQPVSGIPDKSIAGAK